VAFGDRQNKYIKEYVTNHVESKQLLTQKQIFLFIECEKDRESLLNQFIYTRILYKFLEGVQAENSLLYAEVKIQIILYLSLIEYCCDYLITNQFQQTQSVKNTLKNASLKKVSLNKDLMKQIAKSVNREENDFVISVKDNTEGTKSLSKIRFADKLDCIGATLTELDNKKGYSKKKIMRRERFRKKTLEEVKELIYYRNNIHLSHELTNDRRATLADSKKAYKCVKKFSDIVNTFV